MKLGARVTLLATLLVVPVLAAIGYAVLHARRAELEADLSRQAHEIADALRLGSEPLAADTAVTTLTDRVWRARERDDVFQLEILKTPPHDGQPAWQTSDPGWLVLLAAAEFQDAPVERLFERTEGPRSFAMAIPLFDETAMALPKHHPDRRPVAVLGLRRSTEYIDVAVVDATRRMVPMLAGAVVLLIVVVLLALRTVVSAPLRRLLEGIDAVSKGDLSRVILAGRDDEIGTLAARFNTMTGSLREARGEAGRGAAARLTLETRLRQAEKLATIGQMAAEIAHEVGTPLNVIGGRARAIEKKSSDVAEVTKNAEIIQAQVGRITKIINQVLDFSRKRGATSTRVRLEAIVREALGFLEENMRRQGIIAEVPGPLSALEVPGDPDQLQQVFLNLLMNALHAMPHGGRLTVSLAQVTRRKEGLDLAPPAEYAMLQVTDTGAGIAVQNRDDIFEPFFTTKAEGQGTGLGLAVSHGIVKDHDGWIEVESPPAGATQGTVFRVFLPRGHAEASPVVSTTVSTT